MRGLPFCFPEDSVFQWWTSVSLRIVRNTERFCAIVMNLRHRCHLKAPRSCEDLGPLRRQGQPKIPAVHVLGCAVFLPEYTRGALCFPEQMQTSCHMWTCTLWIGCRFNEEQLVHTSPHHFQFSYTEVLDTATQKWKTKTHHLRPVVLSSWKPAWWY